RAGPALRSGRDSERNDEVAERRGSRGVTRRRPVIGRPGDQGGLGRGAELEPDLPRVGRRLLLVIAGRARLTWRGGRRRSRAEAVEEIVRAEGDDALVALELRGH